MKVFTRLFYWFFFALALLCLQEANAQSILNPSDSVYTYDTTQAKGSPSNPNLPALNSIGKWIRTVRLNWNTNQWKAYVYNGPNGVGVPFRLLYPKSYNPTANDGKVYPMIVFYHGVGEAGPVTDNEYSLANGGPVFTNAENSGAFDGYILVFQSTGSWGPNHNVYTTQVINYMVANNKLSPFEVIINGLSAGGYNTWNFMETFPQYTAGALPMSGVALQDNSYINTFKYTPIWLFQGGLDGAPDPGTAANVVGQVTAAGGNIKYTLYPTLGHGTWDQAWSEPDFFPFCGRQYASNPWTLFGRTQFCPGSPVSVTMGVAPGYDAYQWRMNGTVIPGATTDSLQVTQYGTYDCRVQRLGIWSDWSHTPVVISVKQPTITPPISVSGLMSDAIPGADGNNYVNLQVPDSGYTSYTWKKVGSDSVVGTARIYKATSPGQYIVSVTQQYGCSSVYSPPFTVINAAGTHPPSAATNLVAHATSFTTVELDWARNPNPTYPEVAFEIYRSINSGGPYTYVGQAPADTVHYIDKGLTPNIKYYYVVRAIDSTAAAPLSNQAFTITQSDKTPPTAPTGLTVTNTTQTSVSLRWNSSTDNVGVTGYYVYVNGSKSYSTTDTTFTVNALTSKQQYAFTIVAVDGSGNASNPSNQVSAATIFSGLNYSIYTTANGWSVLPNFSTLTPVSSGKMSNVSISNTPQTTNFGYTWSGYIRIPVAGTYTFATTSDDGSALWFNTNGPNGTPLVNNDGLHGDNTATGTVTLQPGTYPIYIEYFQNGGGYDITVSWSSQQLFGNTNLIPIADSFYTQSYTPAGTAPAMPTVVKANATSYNKVNVTWVDNSNNETGFEIYRSTSLNGTYAIVSTTAANVTSFTDSTVAASTMYYYRIQAINKYGASGFDPASIGGIQYWYYTSANSWSNLAPLNSTTPVSSGVLTNISLSPTTQSNNYAFKYQGVINIPTTGTYTFYTSSDDGSDLYVGGYDSAHLVVKNDYLQGATQRSGQVTLTKGSYPFYVTYFQAGGSVALTVSWQGPGISFSAIPDSAFANKQAVTTTFALPAVPTVPTGAVATALSASTVALSWHDTSSAVTSFQLYRSVGDSAHFINFASFPATTFSYVDTGLFSNQTYYYKLVASGIGGNSAYGPTVSAVTKDTIPAISKISDTAVRYGTTTTLTVSASSAVSSALSFAGVNLPHFITLTDNHNGTATLTLSPAQTDSGSYSGIGVVVSDTYGGKDTSRFNLAVNNNYAPTLDSIGNYTMHEGDTLTIPLSGHEQNTANTLSFTASNLPNNYTIVSGATNGQATLQLRPTYAASGVYSVQVNVHDQNTLNATRTFTLTVLDKDPTVKTYVRFPAGDTLTGIWNGVTSTTSTGFFDSNHNSTGLGLTLPASWWPATYPGGPTTGNNSGVYPDAVLKDYYFFAYYGGPDTVNAVITGMDTTRQYNLTFFASSAWTGTTNNGSTKYTVGNQSVTLAVQNNTQNTVTLSNLKPASNGTITFTMARADANTPVGYINALVITKLYNDSTAPATPKSLTAQNISGTGVGLSWVDVAYNAVSYQVYRSTSANGTYAQLASLPSTATGYTDSTTSGATQYYYKVQASNSYGLSPFTPVDSILTSDRIPKLNALANVTTSAGQTVTVNVTATDDPTDHVTLTASNLPSFASFVDNGNGTGTMTITPGAGTNGTYNGITITATDLSDSSSSASFSIYVVEPNISSTYVNFTDSTLAPRPWNNMSGIPFAGTVLSNLTDDSNTPTGISVTLQDGFQGNVEVGTNPNNGTNIYPASVLKSGFFTTSTSASRLLISGLNPAKAYNFVFFNSYSVGVKAVTNFTLNGQTLSLDASFNSNKTVQFNGITPSAGGTVTISVQVASGQAYAILSAMVIQAYDPTVVPLMSPSNLMVTSQTRTAIGLQWQDRASNETGYEVWRSQGSNGSFSLLTTLPANTTSYSDTGLTSDNSYYYIVRAVNGSTHSGYSNTASTYTYASQIYIAFDDGTLTPKPGAPWNNLNTPPQLNWVWSNFLNDQSIATNVGMVQTARWEGLYGGGLSTGNNSGVYPDNVMIQSFGMFAGETSNVTLTGLDLSKTYDFTFFASATGVFDATAAYTVNGSQPVYLNANQNTKSTVTLYGIRPNADGTALVTITANQASQSQFALIGALVVSGSTPNSNTAPAPPASTQTTSTAHLATASQLGATSAADSIFAAQTLGAYPNPFSQAFTLTVPASSGDNVLVTITDASGRPVFQQRLENLYQGTNQVQVQPGQALAPGVYFLRVFYLNRNVQKTIRIMKK